MPFAAGHLMRLSPQNGLVRDIDRRVVMSVQQQAVINTDMLPDMERLPAIRQRNLLVTKRNCTDFLPIAVRALVNHNNVKKALSLGCVLQPSTGAAGQQTVSTGQMHD